MDWIRRELDDLPEYRAGRVGGPVEAVGAGQILLASNESPWDPPQAVISAMEKVLHWLNRYPSRTNEALREVLADWHGVEVSNVMVGCGGVEIGRLAGNIVLGRGQKAVFGAPSFPDFEILTRLCGGEPVLVPLRDLTYDLDSVCRAIDHDTRLAIICNPNNPTGTGVDDVSLRHFLEAVPAHCLVLVDEAYWEYTNGALGHSAITQVADFPNLVVLRTFSKAFALAGIRVGYGIASGTVIQAMRKVQLPLSVSLVAEAAAIAAVRQRDVMEQRAAEVRAERERVRDRLLALGLRIPVSHGNFLFIPGTTGLNLVEACAANDIAIRRIGDLGSRITIGNTEQNNRVLAIAASTMTEGGGSNIVSGSSACV